MDENLQIKINLMKLNQHTRKQDFRLWEPVEKWNESCDRSSFQFKIISYNVLAQILLESQLHLYTKCSPRNLQWEVRAQRIYDEILNLEPDIMCFQEVQASHLNSFYSKFEKLGYSGVFKQKTGYDQHDGCAIYFKRSIFHMEDHIDVEFYQPDKPFLDRNNVGVALRLSPRGPLAPTSSLVVATTHLLYNPKRNDVRMAQINLFLAKIDRFAYYHNGAQSGHYPIILTGDLNSPPDSAVIKVLDQGYISANHSQDNFAPRTDVSDNSEQSGRPAESTSTSEHPGFSLGSQQDHGLNLASVYTHHNHNGVQEVTTFHGYWVTVDYIYFSRCSTLKLLKRLRLPTVAECGKIGAIPNNVYASDHFALAALFEFKTMEPLR